MNLFQPILGEEGCMAGLPEDMEGASNEWEREELQEGGGWEERVVLLEEISRVPPGQDSWNVPAITAIA